MIDYVMLKIIDLLLKMIYELKVNEIQDDQNRYATKPTILNINRSIVYWYFPLQINKISILAILYS